MSKKIESVIANVLGELGARKPSRYAAATKAWQAVTTEDQARHSEPYALRGKILFVRVDDSTRAFELSRSCKKSLIRRMQDLLGEDGLHDIRFRVGELSRSRRSLTKQRG